MKTIITISRTEVKAWIMSIAFIAIAGTSLLAQEEYDFTFNFKTLKVEDGSRQLIVDFSGEGEEDVFPVLGAEIAYFNVLEDSVVALGTAKTSEEGVATLVVGPETKLLRDEEGYMTFRAAFEGTGNMDSFEEEVSVIDVNLSMEFTEEDSIRTLMVYATYIDGMGEELPVVETDIYFYVQGMINLLPIYDDWLEDGEYAYEFPTDLPGDKDGNLKVFVRIEDSDEFGNLRQSSVVQWGTGPMVDSTENRKLFTDLGPEWMIGLLTIVLILVWANLIHAIINLVRIKKEGKQLSSAS